MDSTHNPFGGRMSGFVGQSHEPVHWIAFDIESVLDPTELDKDPEQPGRGWARLRKGEGGISIAVTWDSLSQEYDLFDGHTTFELIEKLESFPVVAVYSKQFDIPFLEGWCGRSLNLPQVIDPLDWLRAHYGKPTRGTKLTQIAEWTLGEGKDAHSTGAAAPGLFAQGRLAELVRYCKADVQLLRDLIYHVREHEFLHGPDGRVDIKLPPWMKDLA